MSINNQLLNNAYSAIKTHISDYLISVKAFSKLYSSTVYLYQKNSHFRFTQPLHFGGLTFKVRAEPDGHRTFYYCPHFISTNLTLEDISYILTELSQEYFTDDFGIFIKNY